jgi:hypothetical protein
MCAGLCIDTQNTFAQVSLLHACVLVVYQSKRTTWMQNIFLHAHAAGYQVSDCTDISAATIACSTTKVCSDSCKNPTCKHQEACSHSRNQELQKFLRWFAMLTARGQCQACPRSSRSMLHCTAAAQHQLDRCLTAPLIVPFVRYRRCSPQRPDRATLTAQTRPNQGIKETHTAPLPTKAESQRKAINMAQHSCRRVVRASHGVFHDAFLRVSPNPMRNLTYFPNHSLEWIKRARCHCAQTSSDKL